MTYITFLNLSRFFTSERCVFLYRCLLDYSSLNLGSKRGFNPDVPKRSGHSIFNPNLTAARSIFLGHLIFGTSKNRKSELCLFPRISRTWSWMWEWHRTGPTIGPWSFNARDLSAAAVKCLGLPCLAFTVSVGSLI